MARKTALGHRMQKKSWDSSEIDKESEDKKIGLFFLGVVLVMILMAFLMWWIKNTL